MGAVESIRGSVSDGKLVIVAGAGVSMALSSSKTPAPNWTALINNALQFAQQKGKITGKQRERWSEALNSDDMDDLLSAAEFIARKLDAPNGILYARWLENEFSKMVVGTDNPMRHALHQLSKYNVPICTLNYDTLIESSTKLPTIDMNDARRALEWARRETTGVLHLHGVWNEPPTCVLGIGDYLKATSDEFRSHLQRALSSFNRLLFIGCGDTLNDPNFTSLIRWMKSVLGGAGLQHYALVADKSVAEKHADEHWHGFVEPVGFGPKHEDLPKFIIENIVSDLTIIKSKTSRPRKAESPVIRLYREHLLRDCGQMTIEGVRADADTAKQKFDIEKLFVPLSIKALPPSIPQSDPQREEKLKKWEDDNQEPISFGTALKKNSKIALLALPGGGKTLLLKRLAVAYADPERRNSTNDELPALDLMPILVRCRDWRDHIRLPISTILERMGEITGQPELNGLYEAALARFKAGKVLLLIDGLDEIHSDADRSTFVENLEIFLNLFPKIRLVVTSREAGFALIAPCLVRFCSRWRIAPLSGNSIKLLCTYWHQLMGGDNQETDAEIRSVVDTLLRNDALKRLAENPLLLTMLLVVKHGYGRLPPDRVSLYERAVEVLLDTWNIKGHDALNPREAVPQLAYVALRLMQKGQQTATERELLEIIEECRQKVPLVKLYAKDSPSEFLKRVELRSSLLLEGGRIAEGGKTVAFYQFRHLTFQEYLAAVASVEGHYDDYIQGQSAIKPLADFVVSEEWKEVVPMAAVLAKKQAEPLLKRLINLGAAVEKEFLEASHASGEYEWSSHYRMPAPIARLTQCLIEEAEFSQSSLHETLRLVSTFAHGCIGPENWGALGRGPFGDALFETAWKLFKNPEIPKQAWLRNTVSVLAAYGRSYEEWFDAKSLAELTLALESDDLDRKGWASSAICGLLWLYHEKASVRFLPLKCSLEHNLNVNVPATWATTAWALGLLWSRSKTANIYGHFLKEQSLDILTKDWLERVLDSNRGISSFTLAATLTFPRAEWRPKLNNDQVGFIVSFIKDSNIEEDDRERLTDCRVAALLAYHHGGIATPEDISSSLKRFPMPRESEHVAGVFEALDLPR